MSRRPVFPVLLALMAGLVTLVGVPNSTKAKQVKHFDRSGNLVIEEKTAAEMIHLYSIKNRKPAESFPTPSPPFSEGIFPCSECHADMEPNLKRRQLEYMHTDIVLNHAEGQRWCLDCHNPNDRDKLRLVSGELIEFTESYRLCGQCHGDKYRDWKVGIHGKRTGYWNGDKQYLLCPSCHNPHDPKFKPLAPMPPPVRPDAAR